MTNQTGGAGTAYPILQSLYAVLAANVTMTTGGTYYDGPSITPIAGTWLLYGAVVITSVGGAGALEAKLWDGTTVAASGYQSAWTAGAAQQISFPGVVVVTDGTHTYKISASSNVGGATIDAAIPLGSAGNNASYIGAVRIA